MAAPFCTACGAAVADGTRFCVKCGQPVGQAAPPPVAQTLVFTQAPTAPPPAQPPAQPLLQPLPPPPLQPPPQPPAPPPAVTQAPVWTPPPPPPPVMRPPVMPPPVKDGPGAGLWIGIFGILLLVGGAGLWFYTARGPGAHVVSTVQVTAVPTEPTPVQPPPAPSAPPPTPNPVTEVIPPNPDVAQKDVPPPEAPKQPAPPKPQPEQTRPAVTAPKANPVPEQPVRAARQTSGVLHASVEVAQNGEVVFENLPGARLKFTFDHSAWQPTISHQPNGTQTLVMRSLKRGIQTTCDVSWEIVQ
jgi:hypothetical protein